MKERKQLVIFCSSSYDIEEKYNEAAREVVRVASLHEYSIVSGGAIRGTMGVISEEAHKLSVWHKGVLPRFMQEYKYEHLNDLVWTSTMAERKEAMREGTELAIALPGGIGTLDELIETYVLAKLDKYKGKIIALNTDGFYDKLKLLLDHYVDTSMMTTEDRALIFFPNTIAELEALLD